MENDKKNNKKSIIFGITKLDLGGAERVLVDMCNKLCTEYDITILTIYSGGILEKELNKKIKIISLYNKQNTIIPIYLFVFGKYVYSKYIKGKFDIEIAFLEGPITRIFRYKNIEKTKKIAWVHNDIKLVFGKGIKARLKNYIDKTVYKKYDLIIFVSKDNQKSFNNVYGNKFNEKVIYNYIDKDRVLRESKEKINNEIYNKAIQKKVNQKNKKDVVLLSVCRLSKQKGLDRLIKIHKRLIDEGINNKIFVIGEGEERNKLEKIIEKYDVSSSFFLLGKIKNPYPYIKMCDIFILASYYEGYGMVIEEAKILNKKIIITETAAKEAVNNYSNAVIVKNNEEDIYRRLKYEIINFNSNI